MQLVEGTIVADRFRLIRVLGQGGMGSVWMAHHTALDVPCAVKFIHGEAARSADLRARFEREAKAAAQIRSPNVVQILDHGVWEGTPYIAMEYLEGEDLHHRLRRVRRLDPRAIVSIVSQVCRALGKAHAAGLVHRDLKPANIFLVRDDEHEVAKVLDFGVAKVNSAIVGGENTKTGAVLGTPYYMSPEQGQGTKVVDHRSDLWSLAVVVYQCLTGQLPFKSDGFGELLMMIMVHPLPVPSQVAPVPPGFDAWWMRAVARDPAQRFQSAKELAEALALALGVTMGGVPDLGASGARSGITAPMTFNTWPVASSPPSGANTGAAVVAVDSGARAAPPPKGKGVLVAGIIGAAVVVGVALGAFLAFGRGTTPAANAAPTAAPARATATAEIASATASASAAPVASAEPSAEPAPSSSAVASAAPAPAPTQGAARPPAKPAAPGKAPAGPKPPAGAKTPDFGI